MVPPSICESTWKTPVKHLYEYVTVRQGIICIGEKGQDIVSGKWREVAQSCLTLCNPMGLLRSSVHGIFQARILEWVAISFSRGSSRPRDRTWVSRTVGWCFTFWATREIVPALPLLCVTLNESLHLQSLLSWSVCGLERNFQTWGRMRGNAIRTVDWLKGEPIPFYGLEANVYSLKTKKNYGWKSGIRWLVRVL